MAAYYPQQRQRLPPIPDSLLEERNSAPHAPPPPQAESYLIFPEPTTAGHFTSTTVPSAPAIIASVSTSNGDSLSPVSPTQSSVSLQTSLLASVAQRSTSRDPTTFSQRSISRDAPSASSSEWEELKGPLPQPPFVFQPRGRSGRGPQAKRSLSRHTESLAEETEEDESAAVAGIGWDWTLDKDESSGSSLRPEDLLLGWRWTSSRSSGGGVEGEAELLSAEIETWYEDAVSQWNPIEAEEFVQEEGGPNIHRDALRGGYPSFDPISPLPRIRVVPGALDLGEHPPQNMASFSKPRVSTGRRHRETRLSPRRRAPAPVSALPPLSVISLPFRTLLQALFSVDQSTLDLLESSADTKPPRPTTLFGLEDDITTIHSEPAHEEESSARTWDRSSRLSLEAAESPITADRMLRQGFTATHLISKNPFTLPFVLLNLGWEYGIVAFKSAQRKAV